MVLQKRKAFYAFTKQRIRLTFLSISLSILVLNILSGCSKTMTTPGRAQPTAQQVESAAAVSSAAVGKPAPDFSLSNQENKAIRLRNLQGSWVVLYFYPKDDTPGCACQATTTYAPITATTTP